MSTIAIDQLAMKSLEVSDHTDAMLGYWDKHLICRYANRAYLKWFGRKPEQMIDKMTMQELLGPLFEKNLPYINAVLLGKQQVFERDIPLPSGEVRKSIATYYPDEKDGEIVGFFVHVADISMLHYSWLHEFTPLAAGNSDMLSNELSDKDILDKIIETLRENIFGTFPGIVALAKKHYISETKLKTSFKARYNTTPLRYYRNLQMEVAHRYLQTRQFNKRQLAALFNLSSPANFDQCYKAYCSTKTADTQSSRQ